MVEISIISPVYNVEDYLPKFINSIINQKFTDWELILVDDGSTDSSRFIIDKFAKSDNRIKAVHKRNGGAPSARNLGISKAKGKYFYFPDPDDWLDKEYLGSLYNEAERTGAQLVISGFKMEYYADGNSYIFNQLPEEKQFLNKVSVRENIHNYFDNMMIAVPWNKLYKANYINENHLLFPNIKWDDLHFNLEVIKDIDSIVIAKESGYHFFRTRPGSETTKVFDGTLYKRRKEQFKHILDIYHYWNVQSDKIMSVIYGYYAGRLVQCVQEIASSREKNKRKYISNILNDKLTTDALQNGEIPSKLLRVSSYPLTKKNITMCLLMGKTISFIKEHMTGYFYYLKAKSVNKVKKVK